MIGRLAQRRKLCRMCTGLERLGKRTRKELYRLGTSGNGVIAAFIRGVAEHGDANPGQSLDCAPQFGMGVVSAPAAIRCYFAWSDRDYRELGRSVSTNVINSARKSPSMLSSTAPEASSGSLASVTTSSSLI
jgi:hypothetical protein